MVRDFDADSTNSEVLLVERLVADYLERNGWPNDYTPGSHNKIDIRCKRKDGKGIGTVEVKLDRPSTRSGNVVFETRSVYDSGGEVVGWGPNKETQLFAIASPQQNGSFLIRFINAKKFREVATRGSWREISTRNSSWTTYALLIPIVTLERAGAIIHQVCLTSEEDECEEIHF